MSQNEEKKKKPFFTVDYSKVEQPEEQKILQQHCRHHDADTDISLVDGNHPNRKSTLINGYCSLCGYRETTEI